MADWNQVHLAHSAMATQFEIVLHGRNGQSEMYLHGAAEEVMREIDRWEAKLSYYREDSDVRQINAWAARKPVPLNPLVFALLKRAQELNRLTQGTFDITVAPLMRCWGFIGASGRTPTEAEIAQARTVVGMQHVVLNEDDHTVYLDKEGVEIDLGAIGKGYAIERCVEILEEFEIESALLHGGTSAVYALGTPPDKAGWQIAIQKPFATQEGDYLAVVELRDESLSVSAPHGKWFASEGKRYGHVIDPRTGWPASHNLLAALILPSATDGDALSTGLLTLGETFLAPLREEYPGVRGLVAVEGEDGMMQIHSEGITSSAL